MRPATLPAAALVVLAATIAAAPTARADWCPHEPAPEFGRAPVAAAIDLVQCAVCRHFCRRQAHDHRLPSAQAPADRAH